MTKTSLSIKKDENIMIKFECDCPNRHCHAENTQNDKPSGCLFGNHESNWRESGSYEPSPLPKLTAAVFERPDCPKWARFAAVDYSGHAWIYEDEPILTISRWNGYKLKKRHARCQYIGKFDASRWRNSPIERPAKPELPSWCTVGAWVYADFNGGEIFKISAIEGDYLCGNDKNGYSAKTHICKCHPVTWRAWTVDEIVPLLPLVARWKERNDKFTSVICTAYDSGAWVGNACTAISYDDLLRDYVQLSGLPCGVPIIGEVGR